VPKRYARDPIIEAIAEFRFSPGEPWDGSEPGRLYERVKEQFPKREAGFSLQQEITEAENQISQRVTPQPRLRLIREDNSAFIQIAPHALSIHSLEPYMGWNALRPLVEQTVTYYRDIVSPVGIGRVGLRYINRIELSGTVELEDYFDLFPYRGPGLPADYAAVRALLHFLYDDGGALLRAEISDVPSRETDTVAFLLDFDYFTAEPDRVDWETLPDWLDIAHERVNAAFEGSIKQRLRDHFGPVGDV
jgi:uncharacterized protein (TIGR04255 family)